MPTPKFRFQPINEEDTHYRVFTPTPGDDDGFLLQGVVYETADRNWVADWSERGANIAMPGFASQTYAAEALYRYAPPAQSAGSRPAGKVVPLSDDRQIDTSVCGCCVNNGCECEGTNRVSARYGITQSYEIQPSLIPEQGVLVSLMPMKGGDFLVDLNTRGLGTGIGYLQRLDDGTYELRVGHKAIGRTDSPEVGMWTCLKLHTGGKSFDRLTLSFKPYTEPTDAAPTPHN